MTEKFPYKKGFKGFESDDSDFLKEGGTSPWDVAGDRGGDTDGWKRGQQSRGGAQAWESRGGDDMEFLTPSQSETNRGNPGEVHERLSRLIDNQADTDAMVGGGSNKVSDNLEDADKDKRRYTSSKTARSRQGNSGW